MPYANFLRISLVIIFFVALSIISAFSVFYFLLSVYFPNDGLLVDKTPILLRGFSSSSWLEITTAALQCAYFSVVTFGSLGHADIIPGGIAKFLVVLELFFGVTTVGFLVAKIVSLPVDQIRRLRRNIIGSMWIDRVEKGISPTEDLFGLLKFDTHGIYGVRYHGTDYNKSGKVIGGFEAFLIEIDMPRTEFRVPTTFTKDHGPALVTLMFLADRRNRFNRFQGAKLDLTRKEDGRHLVEGHKIDKSEFNKLIKSATSSEAMAELISRHFPGPAG